VTGTFLLQYELFEPLGMGGIGTVYRARDHRFHRDVAIKILNGRFADNAARARFPEESRILSRLRHENIAAFIEFASDRNTDFLVMEYVRGLTLARILARGPLDESEAIRAATQLANALEEAHRRGVFHSDLKPSNVIVTADFRVKLLDFGHANLIESARRAWSSGRVGRLATLPYLAPETLLDGTVDCRSDVYGLGMLLFEMTTGCRPYPETSRSELAAAIVHLDPVFPDDVAGKLSAPFRRAVLKALAKSPARRYTSISRFAKALSRR